MFPLGLKRPGFVWLSECKDVSEAQELFYSLPNDGFLVLGAMSSPLLPTPSV